MDMPYEPPVPDLLGDVEDSIEDTIAPEAEGFADQLYHNLGAVEFSMENQQLPPAWCSPFEPDPLHGVLDSLEDSIEQQDITGPAAATEVDGIGQELITHDNNIIPLKPSGFTSEPPVPDMGGLFPVRNFPITSYRATGSSTGIRNNGCSMTYCELHEKWVWADDCENCDDFEPVEDSEDDGSKCCRHSFC